MQEEGIDDDDPDYEAEEEEFCSSDDGSLGLESEDEAGHPGDPENVPGMEEYEDLVPLSTRLNKIKSVPREAASIHGIASGTNSEGDCTFQAQPRCDAPAPAARGGSNVGAGGARAPLPPWIQWSPPKPPQEFSTMNEEEEEEKEEEEEEKVRREEEEGKISPS